MKAKNVQTQTEIRLRVGLDENKIPVQLEWMAEDQAENKQFKEVRALMLSLFDHSTYDTLRIDLWTKEMEIGQMDRFVYQSLKGMAESYVRATANKELANELRKFVEYFGEKTGIKKEG